MTATIPQVAGTEIIRLDSLTLEAFRGSEDTEREGNWFSTDADHAAYFGDVVEHTLFDYGVIVLDAAAHPQLAQGGYDADDALIDMMADMGAEMAVLHNWEGNGVCIYMKSAQ